MSKRTAKVEVEIEKAKTGSQEFTISALCDEISPLRMLMIIETMFIKALMYAFIRKDKDIIIQCIESIKKDVLAHYDSFQKLQGVTKEVEKTEDVISKKGHKSITL